MVSCRRAAFGCVAVAVTLIAAGCKDYNGQMEVTGTVKLAGEPLDEGSIKFVPLDKQGTENGSMIKDGRYELPRKSGLKPGKYLVIITSGDGKTPASEDEATAPGGSTNIVSKDRIPEDWNINPTHEIEVKADGKNVFDFDIPNAANTKKR